MPPQIKKAAGEFALLVLGFAGFIWAPFGFAAMLLQLWRIAWYVLQPDAQ